MAQKSKKADGAIVPVLASLSAQDALAGIEGRRGRSHTVESMDRMHI